MSPDQFLLFSEVLPEPIFLITSKGEIIEANSPAYKILGVKPTLGRRYMLSNFVPEDSVRLKDSLRLWSRCKATLPASLQLRVGNGCYKQFHCRGALIRPSSDGSPSLIIVRCQPKLEMVRSFVALNDNIQRLKSEIETRKRAEETVRHIATGVSAHTGETFFRSLVLHLSKIFNVGYTYVGLRSEENQDELTSLAFSQYGKIVDNISYDMTDTPSSQIMNFSTDQIHAYPCNIQDVFPKDKMLTEKKIQSYVAAPLLNARRIPVGLVVVMDDKPLENTGQVQSILQIFAARCAAEIERLNAESKLRRYQDGLELLVEERSKELRAAQDRLVRKERLASIGQLTATVSHELRNPLGSIRNALAVLRRIIDLDNHIALKSMEIAERGVSRCDNIITELLDFSRVRKLKLQSTNIDNWLANILSEYNFVSEIELVSKLNCGVTIDCDQESLLRAVLNVLSNACDAVTANDVDLPLGQKPTLIVSTQQVKDSVKIIIEDNGLGMSEELLPKIYEPLFSTKSFGVGLGLSVVKQIVEQHQGSVHIDSEAGQGARVQFLLPLQSYDEAV